VCSVMADAYGEACGGCPLAASTPNPDPTADDVTTSSVDKDAGTVGPILPTCQHSPRALESRMSPWDGNDKSLLDCVNLGDAQERRVRSRFHIFSMAFE